jgi:ribosome-binding protein aMBF1 (putative translation factor)
LKEVEAAGHPLALILAAFSALSTLISANMLRLMIIFHTVGKALKIARIEADWDQGDLARAMGIRQGYLSHVERGKMQPSPQFIKKLPLALRLRVREAMIAEIEEEL